MTDPEKESEKRKGLSTEAWAAMSAIAVAIIGGFVTVFTEIWKNPPPNSPPSTPASVSPTRSSPSIPNSSPTVSLPPSPSAQAPSSSAQSLAQDLDAVNIDFSDPKELDHLSNPFSKYPQFATGCLKLLSEQRLKKKVYFDVIFWNYTEELGGKINSDSPDGDINTNILKTAIVRAYNTRNGSNALSFGDIVEPKS
jgi:hypothetical protein